MPFAGLRPRVERADEKKELVGEKRAELERVLPARFGIHRENDAVLVGGVNHVRRVARLDGDDTLRKAFLKLAQHRRQHVLAGCGAGPDAQTRAAPFAEVTEVGARRCTTGW